MWPVYLYSKSAMQCSPAAESSSPGTSAPRSLQRLSRTGSCGRSRWNLGMNIKSTRYDQGKTKRDRDRELYIYIFLTSYIQIKHIVYIVQLKLYIYILHKIFPFKCIFHDTHPLGPWEGMVCRVTSSLPRTTFGGPNLPGRFGHPSWYQG